MSRNTCSLIGLGIVGKANEPIYLCECARLISTTHNDGGSPSPPTPAASTADHDDVFGFTSMPANTPLWRSLSLHHQGILFAALDRVDERVGAARPDGSMPLRRHHHQSSHWLGPILHVQRHAVYGYVTATNIKFLALVEHDNDDQRPFLLPVGNLPAPVEAKLFRTHVTSQLKLLLTNMHVAYINHLQNPLGKLPRVEAVGRNMFQNSATWDGKLASLVREFNEHASTVPAANTEPGAAS